MSVVRLVLIVITFGVLLSGLALWWRSRTHSDVLAISTPGGRLQAVASHRGGVVGFASDVPFQADGGGYFDGVDCPAEDLDAINDSVFDKTAVTRSAIGFKLATSTLTVGGMPRDYYAVRVPHWAIAAASGLTFVVLARGPLQRRRWRKQGRCTACGYDLRESPERCPECGSEGAGVEAGRGTGGRGKVSRKAVVVALAVFVGLMAGALALRKSLPSSGGWGPDDTVVRLHRAGDLAESRDWPPGGLFAWKSSIARDGDAPVVAAELRFEQLAVLAEAIHELPAVNDAGGAFYEAGPSISDRVLVNAPATVQRGYADLLQSLRSPIGASLLTIVAGDSAPATRAVQDVQDKLATVMPDVNFDGIELDAAIKQIREATRANIIVDWSALEAVGIDPRAPVELRVWDLPAAMVLSEVLKYVGGTTAKLRYRVEDRVVRMTTAQELSKHTELRIYDVRRLLQNAASSRQKLIKQLDEVPDPKQPCFPSTNPAGDGGASDPYTDAAYELVSLIQETIEPDDWRANGGAVGSIREWAGRLLVQQTPEGHRELEALLKKLDDAYAAPPPTTRSAASVPAAAR